MAILLQHHAVKEVRIVYNIEDYCTDSMVSVYRAHETTATEPFAIALFCGDVKCDVSSPV